MWDIREPYVTITFDGLMSPTEDYFSGVFFQVTDCTDDVLVYVERMALPLGIVVQQFRVNG